jgi:hypothetical protein
MGIFSIQLPADEQNDMNRRGVSQTYDYAHAEVWSSCRFRFFISFRIIHLSTHNFCFHNQKQTIKMAGVDTGAVVSYKLYEFTVLNLLSTMDRCFRL